MAWQKKKPETQEKGGASRPTPPLGEWHGGGRVAGGGSRCPPGGRAGGGAAGGEPPLREHPPRLYLPIPIRVTSAVSTSFHVIMQRRKHLLKKKMAVAVSVILEGDRIDLQGRGHFSRKAWLIHPSP